VATSLVKFPPNNANHNRDQVFYFDLDFMLRRMDYAPDVTGGQRAAHYTYRPKSFHGLVYPTERFAYSRSADGTVDMRHHAISLHVADVDIET
jgi:hypothetical protein